MKKRKPQEELCPDLCPDCRYTCGPNHEAWCPKLHPGEWSWLLRAKQGHASREYFYEGAVQDQQALANAFAAWISQEQERKQIGTGTFNLQIFHLFRGRPMHHSEYTVSFVHGCELWGNNHAQRDIIQAWQQAGGRYRASS